MSDKKIERTIAAYNKAALRYQQYWGQQLLTTQVEQFVALLPTNALLLDIGCGGGRDMAALIARGRRVVGIDLSPAMLTVAQRTVPPGSLLLSDLRHLPVATGSVNGIWAAASLLHLPRIQIPPALAGFCRVLRPGGVLFIAVKEGRGAAWSTHDPDIVPDPRFYTYLTLSELRGWLQECGCTIQRWWRNVPPGATHPWLNLLSLRR